MVEAGRQRDRSPTSSPTGRLLRWFVWHIAAIYLAIVVPSLAASAYAASSEDLWSADVRAVVVFAASIALLTVHALIKRLVEGPSPSGLPRFP